MSFKITFINHSIGREDATLVYRSKTTMDDTAMPEPLATLPPGATEFTDTTAVPGEMYYYRFGTKFGNEIILTKNRAIRVVSRASTGPGPNEIKDGDWNFGFFGFVSSSDFVSYSGLIARFGLDGTTYNDTGWLKFAHLGKVLYMSLSPVIYDMDYLSLYNAGIVYGTNDNGLCVPDGATPTNQYHPFSPDGNCTVIPRIWRAFNNPEDDLLNSVSIGITSADYVLDVNVPVNPQTKTTEYDLIMGSINRKPMYVGATNMCRFGYYGPQLFKLDGSNSPSGMRQSDLCQQPAGTSNKKNVNTRGFAYISTESYRIPHMSAISVIPTSAKTSNNSQMFGNKNLYYSHSYRPILELEL